MPKRKVYGVYVRTSGDPELWCLNCWGENVDHDDVVGVTHRGGKDCFMCCGDVRAETEDAGIDVLA